jgi:hypothetical protein
VLLGIVEFGISLQFPFYFVVLAYVFWITPNYFLEIIEHKAVGNAEWPVFSIETLVAGRNVMGIFFCAVTLVLAGSYFALRHAGIETGARILLGAGLGVLPASVALLAVTREPLAALNPIRILAAAIGFGHGYLYCLLGGAAILGLLELAQARGGLWYFPLVYGLFLQAFLIGRIVYARRTRLGVHAPRSPEARAERARAETVAIRNGILSHAYGFAAHGNKAGALRHIERYIETDENSLEARLWIFNEIARWEDSDVALRFAEHLVEYCDARGFTKEAAGVRARCEYLIAHGDRGVSGI